MMIWPQIANNGGSCNRQNIEITKSNHDINTAHQIRFLFNSNLSGQSFIHGLPDFEEVEKSFNPTPYKLVDSLRPSLFSSTFMLKYELVFFLTELSRATLSEYFLQKCFFCMDLLLEFYRAVLVGLNILLEVMGFVWSGGWIMLVGGYIC